jgi:hypothetical protein
MAFFPTIWKLKLKKQKKKRKKLEKNKEGRKKLNGKYYEKNKKLLLNFQNCLNLDFIT